METQRKPVSFKLERRNKQKIGLFSPKEDTNDPTSKKVGSSSPPKKTAAELFQQLQISKTRAQNSRVQELESQLMDLKEEILLSSIRQEKDNCLRALQVWKHLPLSKNEHGFPSSLNDVRKLLQFYVVVLDDEREAAVKLIQHLREKLDLKSKTFKEVMENFPTKDSAPENVDFLLNFWDKLAEFLENKGGSEKQNSATPSSASVVNLASAPHSNANATMSPFVKNNSFDQTTNSRAGIPSTSEQSGVVPTTSQTQTFSATIPALPAYLYPGTPSLPSFASPVEILEKTISLPSSTSFPSITMEGRDPKPPLLMQISTHQGKLLTPPVYSSTPLTQPSTPLTQSQQSQFALSQPKCNTEVSWTTGSIPPGIMENRRDVRGHVPPNSAGITNVDAITNLLKNAFPEKPIDFLCGVVEHVIFGGSSRSCANGKEFKDMVFAVRQLMESQNVPAASPVPAKPFHQAPLGPLSVEVNQQPSLCDGGTSLLQPANMGNHSSCAARPAPVPASDVGITTFPVQSQSSKKSDQMQTQNPLSCIFCLECIEFASKEGTAKFLTYLPCCHRITHHQCIVNWLSMKDCMRMCPCCFQAIFEVPQAFLPPRLEGI